MRRYSVKRIPHGRVSVTVYGAGGWTREFWASPEGGYVLDVTTANVRQVRQRLRPTGERLRATQAELPDVLRREVRARLRELEIAWGRS